MAESIAKVSVVIPCRNEVNHIKACINSVLNNDYGTENIEIIIVDGMSNDGSAEAIEQLRATYSTILRVENKEQVTPYAFNIGIKKSCGEYVAIIGSRHILSANYLSECIKILNSNTQIACVGGSVENIFENDTGRAIATAMSSPFGVGGSNFRVKKEDGFVDTVGTPLYRKSIFDEIGYFDENLVRNQDDDFNFRLTKKGYKIYITAKATIKYYVRVSYKNLYRQYFQYGYWKVCVNKKHKTITTLRQLTPACFVLFILFGWIPLWIDKHFYIWLFILIFYALAAFVFAVAGSKHAKDVFNMVFAFFILHISYGLGYLEGIVQFLVFNKKPSVSHTKLSR